MSDPRVLNAVHVSNHPNRYVGTMGRAMRPTGGAVVLHQLMVRHDPDIDDGGDEENDYWLKLRFGNLRHGERGDPFPAGPERLIVIRVWNQNDPYRFDPAARAATVVRLLSNLTAHGYPAWNALDDPFVAIQATNECDIEPARVLAWPVGQRLDAMVAWESRFWDAFDRLAPGRRCLSCSPNLSFGHDWEPDVPDSEYRHPGLADLIDRHVDTGGLVGLHVYHHATRPEERGEAGGQNQFWFALRPWRPSGYRDRVLPGRPRDPGGAAIQIARPDARFVVTEWGTWKHSDGAAAAYNLDQYRRVCQAAQVDGRFLFVAPFIWDTTDAHVHNRIVDSERFRDGLAALPDFATRATVPRARPPFGAIVPDPVEPGAPWVPTPIPPDAPSFRLTDFPFVAAVPEPGDGWAKFAGRIAGWPDAPYRIRTIWAEHVLAANGLRRGIDGSWPNVHAHVDGAPRVYRIPRAWYRPGPGA